MPPELDERTASRPVQGREAAQASTPTPGRVGPPGSVRFRSSEQPVPVADEFIVGIYEAHQREIYTFASRSTRSAATAEDVVAETFLRFVAEARAGRVPSNPRAWLYRVAANLIASQSRRSTVATRLRHVFANRDVAEPLDVAIVRDEEFRSLHAALARLPPDARMGLVLAAQGFSGEEIAHVLGKSPTATRTLLCRARMKLREQLSESRL